MSSRDPTDLLLLGFLCCVNYILSRGTAGNHGIDDHNGYQDEEEGMEHQNDFNR
jgi:hypothetical protein